MRLKSEGINPVYRRKAPLQKVTITLDAAGDPLPYRVVFSRFGGVRGTHTTVYYLTAKRVGNLYARLYVLKRNSSFSQLTRFGEHTMAVTIYL